MIWASWLVQWPNQSTNSHKRTWKTRRGNRWSRWTTHSTRRCLYLRHAISTSLRKLRVGRAAVRPPRLAVCRIRRKGAVISKLTYWSRNCRTIRISIPPDHLQICSTKVSTQTVSTKLLSSSRIQGSRHLEYRCSKIASRTRRMAARSGYRSIKTMGITSIIIVRCKPIPLMTLT